jgi:hypothetical protein
MTTADLKEREDPDERRVRHAINIWMVVLAAAAAAASVLFAVSAPGDLRQRVGVGLTAMALSFAAIAVGAFVGFLFGVPRSRAIEESGADKQHESYFVFNSNLLKVSDWLTTILVGLGLVQLGRVGPAVASFSETIGSPLGGQAYSGTFGVAFMLAVGLAALLVAYMWASLRVYVLYKRALKPGADIDGEAPANVPRRLESLDPTGTE